MNYERETASLLRRLGANNSYVGFCYIVYGITRAIQDPGLLTYISKGLNVEVAVRYDTSINCVERNIRTIINTIWMHGDRALLEEVFGCKMEKKRRSGDFITAVGKYHFWCLRIFCLFCVFSIYFTYFLFGLRIFYTIIST